MPSSRRRGKGSSEEEYRETPSQIAGLFLTIIGGAGLFLLAVSPWDWLNALDKTLGVLSSGLIIFAGRILFYPTGKRLLEAKRLLSLPLDLFRTAKVLVTRNRGVEEAW